MSYLRARYFDPATGQFMSRDPMVTTTRQPSAYVQDNPLNATDPTGMCDWLAWLAVPALCSAEKMLAEHPLSPAEKRTPLAKAVGGFYNGASQGLGGVQLGLNRTGSWLATRNWDAFAAGLLEGTDALVNSCFAALGIALAEPSLGTTAIFLTPAAAAAAAIEFDQAGKEFNKWAGG